MLVEMSDKEMVMSHEVGNKVLAYLQKRPFEEVNNLIGEILAEARASKGRQEAAVAPASGPRALNETVPDGM